MTAVADPERAIAYVNVSDNRSLGGLVLDAFLGVASLGIDAIMVNRGFIGIEVDTAYLEEAKARVAVLEADTLTLRPLGTPLDQPMGCEKVAAVSGLGLRRPVIEHVAIARG